MDSETIDLTDESRIDLANDSRYTKIEDSIIELGERSNYAIDKNLNVQLNDDEYCKIDDDFTFEELNKESSNKSNKAKFCRIDEEDLIIENDNKIDDLSIEFDKKNSKSNDKKIYDKYNFDDDENDLSEVDKQFNKELDEIIRKKEVNNESKYKKIDDLSYCFENDQYREDDLNLSIEEDYLLSQQNNDLISNENCSPIEMMDDEDILELDNELSVLFVKTPEKQQSNSLTTKKNNLSNSSSLTTNNLTATNSSSTAIKSPSKKTNSKFTNLKRNLVETSFNQEILIGDLDDLEDLNPFDVNKRKQKRRTKLTDEEKQARVVEKEHKQAERTKLNRQKEKLKEKDKKLKEANKYLNLKNSSQYCTTIISQNLIDKFLKNIDQLRKEFEEKQMKLQIDFSCRSPIVVWKRILHSKNDQFIADRSVLNLDEIVSKEEIEEDQLIFILSKEQFVKMVYKFVLSTGEQVETPYEFDENDQNNISLISYVTRLINQFKKSILFVVYNLESYFRALKNREHRDFVQLMNENQTTNRRAARKEQQLPLITRCNVEESILNTSLELMKNDLFFELKLKIKFQFAENQADLASLICNLACSMSNAPYRRWKNAQQGFDWFVDGDCKSGSVNLKVLPQDISRLWIKHLLLFDKVSLPIAKAIVQKYPNLMALKAKYDSLDDHEAKQTLLTRISVDANRTINSDISKRIFKWLTELNEDEMIV